MDASGGGDATAVGATEQADQPEKEEKPEKANKMKPFSMFPVCGLGAPMVSFCKSHLSEVLASISARKQELLWSEARALEGLPPSRVSQTEHWWDEDSVVKAVFNSDAYAVRAPAGKELSAVLTDGATAVLRFEGAKQKQRRHPGHEALWSSRAEAEQHLRKTPLPDHVTSRPVSEWSGITTLEHLATALKAKLGPEGAAKVALEVIGVDPGKASLVYATRLRLQAQTGAKLFASDMGADCFVTRDVAEELCAEENRYSLGAAVHQQLKGRTQHQRKELAWRARWDVEAVFREMSRYSWRSSQREHLRLLLQLEIGSWGQLMEYHFDETQYLARQGRRARFMQQRHQAVTANRLLERPSRTLEGPEQPESRRRRWRRLAKEAFSTEFGEKGWSERFSDAELLKRWEECCKEAREKVVRTQRAKTKERLRALDDVAGSKHAGPQLTVVVVGDGLFAGGMRGYAPSSHMPFVNELARRPGVVVVFLDEFYTSKKCFVCGSMVKFVHAAEGESKVRTMCGRHAGMQISGSPGRARMGAALAQPSACLTFHWPDRAGGNTSWRRWRRRRWRRRQRLQGGGVRAGRWPSDARRWRAGGGHGAGTSCGLCCGIRSGVRLRWEGPSCRALHQVRGAEAVRARRLAQPGPQRRREHLPARVSRAGRADHRRCSNGGGHAPSAVAPPAARSGHKDKDTLTRVNHSVRATMLRREARCSREGRLVTLVLTETRRSHQPLDPLAAPAALHGCLAICMNCLP